VGFRPFLRVIQVITATKPAKRKPGPKPSAEPKVKITVRVTPGEKQVILRLGCGSLTAGVREMVDCFT